MLNFKRIILNLYSALNADRLLLNNRPRVLFYHGVAENIVDPTVELESIGLADFERQLRYIKNIFHPIGLDEFYDKFKSGKWDKRDILITFDDGYKNMLTTALPLMERYEIPFALFLTTRNISTGELFPTTINRLVNLASSYSCELEDRQRTINEISRFLKSEPVEEVEAKCQEMLSLITCSEVEVLIERYASIRPLNWAEAKIIAASPLCTVGSHCVTHICCHAKQKSEEVKWQFSQSKKMIEDKLGIPCEYLSYPNGSHTPEVMSIAAETGYKLAFTTRYEAVDRHNPMGIGRIYVPYNYARFKYAISKFPR